jgi:hypothetical protein
MKRVLCIVLAGVLLVGLCACSKKETKEKPNETNQSTQQTESDNKENNSINQDSVDEMSIKAYKDGRNLKYDITEKGIKSFITFFECQPSEKNKQNVIGKIYRNNAGNIIIIDNRSEMRPFNITCEIVENERTKQNQYLLKIQYDETAFKNVEFKGTGIYTIAFSDLGTSSSSFGSYPPLEDSVIIGDNDPLAENFYYNDPNVDFSQTIKNESFVEMEVKPENIRKMINFSKTELNSTYKEAYPNSTTYVNQAKNIIIIDQREEKTDIYYQGKIETNNDGEDIFKIIIEYDSEKREIEHNGTGVSTVCLLDGGYMSTHVDGVTSTDFMTN